MGKVKMVGRGDRVTVTFTFVVGEEDGDCVCTTSSKVIDETYANRLIEMSDEVWLEPTSERVRIK